MVEQNGAIESRTQLALIKCVATFLVGCSGCYTWALSTFFQPGPNVDAVNIGKIQVRCLGTGALNRSNYCRKPVCHMNPLNTGLAAQMFWEQFLVCTVDKGWNMDTTFI